IDPGVDNKPRSADAQSEPLPASGQFLNKRFANDAGTRDYKLYVPSTYAGAPLLVMLHGCTQNADDFATGTQANRWAEGRRCLVVYPEQLRRANSHHCWNWFRRADQRHGAGEPAIIAGIAQQVMNEYNVDARRVYVAGLSAGGAMAAIIGDAYPEMFAAVGVHSGLPVGVAHNVPSALALMKTGQAPRRANAPRPAVPLIVLHGDADHTVNPVNAARLIEDALDAYRMINSAPLQLNVQTTAASAGSHAYRRTKYLASDGAAVIERWEIFGAGHAWSGGDAAGSHTDHRGPDATGAMLDFFAQHVLRDVNVETVDAATA
ncbi:MAG: extracellular catalytic domain type 1 short-chain-length polyhydroxyalkanoate depolymerase, partial [Burkholderiaceae bacterium]